MLALALSPLPDILLLDEPVSGVDRKGLTGFYQLVSDLRKQHDLTILLVSHDLDIVARHADRVVLIDGTITAEGSPADVFGMPVFIETFGSIAACSIAADRNSAGSNSAE
jgi:zinc transport system ATP-binding protein